MTPRGVVDLRTAPPRAAWCVRIDDDALERAAARLAARELPAVSSGIAPALFGAFRRGLVLDGEDVDLRPMRDLSDEDTETLFAGHGTFQLIPERAATLRAVTRSLVDDWDGHDVASVGHDAEAIGWLLPERVRVRRRPGRDRRRSTAGCGGLALEHALWVGDRRRRCAAAPVTAPTTGTRIEMTAPW